jgi:hypothetical protein
MDAGYTTPIEEEDGGRGLDPISGLAAVLARASTAVLNSTQALFLRPHSQQLAPPASGSVKAAGEVEVFRGIVVGGPVPLDDGDQVIAQFRGVNGEDEDAPVFEVVGGATILPGSEGPTIVQVRCQRPGHQGNIPASTEGKFLDRLGGSYVLTSFTPGTALLVVDTALGDRFVPTMSGMFWRFTNGLNIGAYARRLTVLSSTTATLDAAGDLTAQGAGGTGRVIDFQEVGNFRIVFRGTTGGRCGELDMLARERTTIGRAISEDDDDFRSRVVTLPEVVSPNSVIRAISAVLDPVGIPFTFIEVFEQSIGFFFDGGANTVDSAFTDPYAYRRTSFYVGGTGVGLTPIGFLVLLNGLTIPAEPDRTRILAALTTTIVGSKAAGVLWAVVFEPPIP